MIYHDTTAIEAVNNGANTPDGFYDPKHPSVLMATSKWHSTDAWRGYTEVTAEPGFREIKDTWVTGDWDDAPAGHSSTEVRRQVKELEEKYGDVFVIFTPTSNVFSTAVNVLVRDGDAAPVDRGKLIGHKTRRFESPDGSFRVRYHATDVVKYDAKTNTYTLNTGGWNTLTTNKRMTEALPAGWYTYRRNWVMYLHRPGEEDVEIKDGMEVKA